MDGSVSIVDGDCGRLIATAHPHTKYVVKAMWACGGERVVTGSYDQTFRVLKVDSTESTSLELSELAQVGGVFA